MKKDEFSGTVITLDIFRCSVIIFVGKDEDTILKGLPGYWKNQEWETKDLKRVKGLLKDVFGDKDNDIAAGTMIPDGVDAIIVFPNKNIAEVSEEKALHELGHAMRHICRVHGVDDEETEMYMHEYLFHQFLCAQNDYNDNKVKRVKI